ncbi:MAG: hypothetical protein EOM06_10920 [Sphingobacteriia bacterium]|nr:hypothetical protein [Sphingobacteriia bacterium]
MDVFKLRIETDENPGFLIDIEILAEQTFLELHNFLVKTLRLKPNELASFYVSDENWEKFEEITLLDMSGEEDKSMSEHDDVHTIYLMSATPVSKFISDINQNLVYEYDFLQLHTFLIECVDVKQEDKRMKYPRVASQKGTFSVVNRINIEKDPEKLRESLLKDFNSIVSGDMDDADDDENLSEDF